MRKTLLAVLVAASVAACASIEPAELAGTTGYRPAREYGSYLEVGGLDIFAIHRGSGRNVILLHGNPASTYSWRYLIEPLSERYSVYAFDFPGFGFSDKPADAPYTPEWLASYVVGYMDRKGIDHAVLVGNSMGGHMATETAMLYPDRVEALVLLDASGLDNPEAAAEEGPPLRIRMLGWPLIGPLLQSLPSRGLVAGQLKSMVYDPSKVSEADVDGYYLPLRSAGGLNGFLARSRQSIPADRAGRVRSIEAPTLVITGADDTVVPVAIARRYDELLPDSELVVIEKTGHLPQEERPERVIAEIDRWLEAHPEQDR